MLRDRNRRARNGRAVAVRRLAERTGRCDRTAGHVQFARTDFNAGLAGDRSAFNVGFQAFIARQIHGRLVRREDGAIVDGDRHVLRGRTVRCNCKVIAAVDRTAHVKRLVLGQHCNAAAFDGHTFADRDVVVLARYLKRGIRFRIHDHLAALCIAHIDDRKSLMTRGRTVAAQQECAIRRCRCQRMTVEINRNIGSHYSRNDTRLCCDIFQQFICAAAADIRIVKVLLVAYCAVCCRIFNSRFFDRVGRNAVAYCAYD